MVERQLRRRGIHDERVLAAMGRVRREDFLPEELRGAAYEDAALPIGHGQTISQPYMVARICEALAVRRNPWQWFKHKITSWTARRSKPK